MQVIYYSGQAVERFDVEVINLVQLYDYFRVNQPIVYKELSEKELCYTVYTEKKEKAYPILPTMLDFDITPYDVLVICPKLEGEALFTSIAASVTAAVAASIGTGIAATAAGYAVATVVAIGLVIALGMLVRALSPQNKLGNEQDPSQLSKLYNGVPNITEQGGSVPVVFGNCLFGGVRIGLRIEQALTVYPDVIPIGSFAEGMAYPSNWMRLV